MQIQKVTKVPEQVLEELQPQLLIIRNKYTQ